MDGFQLDTLRAFPDQGPVTMLNLLKFRERSLDGDGTGRDAYRRYTDAVGHLVEERGGKVLWAAKIESPALVEHGDVAWDWSVLVYYPSRAAFVDMVTSPAYQKANEDRRNGVEKHIILASKTLHSDSYPG